MNKYLTDRKKIVVKNNIAIFSKEWLSNFEQSNFKIGKHTFHCVEQYMHSQKAKLFNDIDCFNKIIDSKSPKECLELGRSVKNYSDIEWAKIRYKVVYDATMNKYIQNYDLLEALLSFDTSVKFVEASEIDCLWGCGLSKNDENIFDKSKWKGHNLLGKAITNVRDSLVKQNYLSTYTNDKLFLSHWEKFYGLSHYKLTENIPNYYSGILKTNDFTAHFKCGILHNEIGPAINFRDDTMSDEWYYNGKNYTNKKFINETWIEFIENLKREEELKIFI